MVRKIVHIDEDKCNGCGACANACHESAIAMVNGKAKLIKDDYCDGMGDCLPECPTGAIRIEEREAEEYDEVAVQLNKQLKELQAKQGMPHSASGGCPGSRMRVLNPDDSPAPQNGPAVQMGTVPSMAMPPVRTQLRNWPVEIKLAPLSAPYYENANLLIAADCTAYAYANFHQEFMRNKVTLIGCPKLDGVDYSEKLKSIIAGNNIKSVTVVRMEVPCCGGLENAAKKALQQSGKFIPWQVVTIGIDGSILDQ